MLLKSLLLSASSSLSVAAWGHVNTTANAVRGFVNTTVNAVTPITSFNLTALTAANGTSVLECWTINRPLTISQIAGIEGAAIQQLGDMSSVVWSSLPGGYTSTPHYSPSPQYVHISYFRQFLYFVLLSTSLY